MGKYLAALLIFMSGEAVAQEWTGTDYALLGGALGLIVVDWGQTRDLIRERENTATVVANGQQVGTLTTRQRAYHEKNPLLGENPTRREVDRAALIGITATAGLSAVLPQTYRRWFLGGVIVVESAVVYENHRIGLRVSF